MISLSGDGKALSFFLNESVKNPNQYDFINFNIYQSITHVINVTEGNITIIYIYIMTPDVTLYNVEHSWL